MHQLRHFQPRRAVLHRGRRRRPSSKAEERRDDCKVDRMERLVNSEWLRLPRIRRCPPPTIDDPVRNGDRKEEGKFGRSAHASQDRYGDERKGVERHMECSDVPLNQFPIRDPLRLEDKVADHVSGDEKESD